MHITQYADDTAYLLSDVTKLLVLVHFLESFGHVSNSRINLGKSTIISLLGTLLPLNSFTVLADGEYFQQLGNHGIAPAAHS
jgi:hypothetical protein